MLSYFFNRALAARSGYCRRNNKEYSLQTLTFLQIVQYEHFALVVNGLQMR